MLSDVEDLDTYSELDNAPASLTSENEDREYRRAHAVYYL